MKTTALLLLIFVCAGFAGIGSNTFALKKKLHCDGAKQLCTSSVRGDNVTDAQAAFGLLYLGWENETANKRLKAAFNQTDDRSDQIQWWLRTYYLFTDKANQTGGRLDDEAKEMLAAYLRRYAQDNRDAVLATAKDVWLVKDDEVTDLSRVCAVYLAMQLLKGDEKIAADYKLLNSYLSDYCKARVSGGLWSCVSSGSRGAQLLSSLINLYDFTEDELLKKRVSMLLDIVWADWAQDELGFIRCGARSETAIPVGDNDDVRLCAMPFLSPDMGWTDGRNYSAADKSFIYIVATTSWRMSDVVMDMILDGSGELEYKSRQPAIADFTADGFMRIRPDEGMLMRYSFGTNEYVMGAFFIDPSIGICGRDNPKGYLPQSLKNSVQGLTFANGAYLLISGRDGIVQAIGNKNIFIFQQTGTSPLKMSAGGGMKDKMTDRGGWLVVREGSTWAAVCGLSVSRPGAGCGYIWQDDGTAVLKEALSPLVMVTASAIKYRQMDDFVKYITEHNWRIKDSVLTYGFTDADNKAASFVMYLNGSASPRFNDKPLNFSDLMLFDSPYIRSVKGSGVITLVKDNRKQMYYINRDEIVDSKP